MDMGCTSESGAELKHKSAIILLNGKARYEGSNGEGGGLKLSQSKAQG